MIEAEIHAENTDAQQMVHFEEAQDLSDAGSLITQAPQSNTIHATINALSTWMSAIQPRESWYLAGWIGDSPIDFLVDPGAVISAISLQCYDRLVETNAILTPMKAMHLELEAAHISDMRVHRMCNLELPVHGLIINIDAVVVDLNCQAILGMDILGDASKLPFILDLVEGTLSGGGYETIQLHRFQAATECFVETTDSVCIPPHSEVMLWAKLKTNNGRRGPTAGVVLALQTFVQENCICHTFGLVQFAVMPFGLCNAPATFERLMSQVMRGLHWKRCLVYIDDILVFGNDFESALHSLELVLTRVAEYGLQLKSTKCNLFRTSVPFLGHIVERAGLECDPNKVSAVANWIPPSTIKGVREFLGFTGYYRRFVPDYSTVAQPLVRLLGKDCKFKRTDACQDAFGALRALLIKATVLAFPKEDLPYIVDTDASDYGIGGVLSQCIEGTEHVIAYYSKNFEPSAAEILHNQTGAVSCGGHLGPFQRIRLGSEICGTNRPRRASLVEQSEEHSRDVRTLAGKVTTVSLRNHT